MSLAWDGTTPGATGAYIATAAMKVRTRRERLDRSRQRVMAGMATVATISIILNIVLWVTR